MSTEAELKEQARAYLRTRGSAMAPAVIQARVTAAFDALEAFLDTVPPDRAARAGPSGAWSVQEIVDHLLETHRPGLDELRCLLAGQRPPGEAIPAGLRSKAPLLRPWPWLRAELRRVHASITEMLAAVPADFTTDARAPLVMVLNVPEPDGSGRPVHWIEDLDWKAYALVWRLHVLDHLHQAKQALAAG